MAIPVFVSRPSRLSARQQQIADQIYQLLFDLGIEPRTINKPDYAAETPLKEVLAIGRSCAGGLILGFDKGETEPLPSSGVYPTPWNHLEAGVLFALQLPLLIFKDPGVTGAVFDDGVAGSPAHVFRTPFSLNDPDIDDIFGKWQVQIGGLY